MRRKVELTLTSLAGLVLALLAAASATPAAARVQCQGNFQISKFGPLATPYCEEEQIARVAQAYGWKVSAAKVHSDPLTKVYVCQILGSDESAEGIVRRLRAEIAARIRAAQGNCVMRKLFAMTSTARYAVFAPLALILAVAATPPAPRRSVSESG